MIAPHNAGYHISDDFYMEAFSLLHTNVNDLFAGDRLPAEKVLYMPGMHSSAATPVQKEHIPIEPPEINRRLQSSGSGSYDDTVMDSVTCHASE
jgi:hypothetical protein